MKSAKKNISFAPRLKSIWPSITCLRTLHRLVSSHVYSNESNVCYCLFHFCHLFPLTSHRREYYVCGHVTKIRLNADRDWGIFIELNVRWCSVCTCRCFCCLPLTLPACVCVSHKNALIINSKSR